MKLSIKWLNELLPKAASDKKLSDKLTSLGLEVANVYKVKNDTIIDIEITPNRADCLSVYGIARDLKSIYKCKINKLKIKKNNFLKNSNIIKSIDKSICSNYSYLQIDGINNKIKTPNIIKERLLNSGLSTINLVVDILNYVMIEHGQPFHAFDLQKINNKLSIRTSKKGEMIDALNEKKYILKDNIPVVADSKTIHAIAGVVGSKISAVKSSSQNILIECAYFIPVNIRQAAKMYRIQTDSSYRFERGVDSLDHSTALGRVIYLLNKYTSYNKISSCNINNKGAKRYKAKKISIALNEFERLLGKKFSLNQIKIILNNLNFNPVCLKKSISITIPSYRFDIENKCDIVEEIARVVGYDNFKPISPKVNMLSKLDNKQTISDKLSSSLISKGYNETKSYSFLPKNFQQNFVEKNKIIKINNPISEDKEEMRLSLLPSLVKIFKYNFNRQLPGLKIFECGAIYESNSANKIHETNVCSGLISGIDSLFNLKSLERNFDFFDLKGDLISLMPDFIFKQCNTHSFLDQNLQAQIIQNKRIVGHCGEISPKLYSFESIKNIRIFAFELALDLLEIKNKINYKPISPYPKIKRDMSLVLDNKIAGNDIIDAILKESYKYLINIRINDLFYDDKQFGKNMKSIALELVFQDFKNTLKDDFTNNQMKKIISMVCKKFNAKLRS